MRRSRPHGITIARALQILPGIVNDDLRDTVAAIDRVHGDGELPAIPLTFVSHVFDALGRPVDGILAAEMDGQDNVLPRSIRIRLDAPHRGFVTLHEIGHFLDAAGLSGAGYSSETHALLSPWRGEVSRSQAVRDLMRLTRGSNPATADRALALVEPTELWARAYAQFVARRSGNAALRSSLSAFQGHAGNDVYLPRQWTDEDFVAIDTAIEALFRMLQWMT
jgi:hypothetical protein